ncbi:hypothetical protein G6F54_013710 [Rhizopus delemar]|nr:hypothetical protein G6F54_013710 [Rhizopus delemar]
MIGAASGCWPVWCSMRSPVGARCGLRCRRSSASASASPGPSRRHARRQWPCVVLCPSPLCPCWKPTKPPCALPASKSGHSERPGARPGIRGAARRGAPALASSAPANPVPGARAAVVAIRGGTRPKGHGAGQGGPAAGQHGRFGRHRSAARSARHHAKANAALG